MRVVVDRYQPYIEGAFRQFGEVIPVATEQMTAKNVREADVIVVRSETRVNRALLKGSRVRFVATATTGTDHVDLEYVRSRGIGFANAPGSNANSVAEYMVAGLFLLCRKFGIRLRGTTLGVVGVGNIGRRVARIGEVLGMRILQNDPPRARSAGGGQFVPLDDLMAADIVTLHVPLTRQGEDATHHLFDAGRIGRMKRGAILVNTSRGGVVETPALKEALASGHLAAAMLDVWEHEPTIDAELVNMAAVATPHVAGYSFEGRLNAVRMMCEAVGRFFGQESVWTGPPALPEPKVGRLNAYDGEPNRLEEKIREIVLQCHPLEDDDRALRTLSGLPMADRPALFRKLRADYPVRREFSATTVAVNAKDSPLSRILSALGFTVVDT